MSPPKLTEVQLADLAVALSQPTLSPKHALMAYERMVERLAPVVARMVAEARAEGWQEGRQWDLLDQYSDTIRQIALSNVRLRRQVREAEQTARAEVGRAVEKWAMKNEIAEPPLDWAHLGEITRWARGGDDA